MQKSHAIKTSQYFGPIWAAGDSFGSSRIHFVVGCAWFKSTMFELGAMLDIFCWFTWSLWALQAKNTDIHNIIYRLTVIPSNSAFGTQPPPTHSRHLIAPKIAAATVLHRQKSLRRQKSIVVWWGRNAGKLQGSLSLKLNLRCYYHLMVGFGSWIVLQIYIYQLVSDCTSGGCFIFHLNLGQNIQKRRASCGLCITCFACWPSPTQTDHTCCDQKKEKWEDSLHSNTVMKSKKHGFSISIFL